MRREERDAYETWLSASSCSSGCSALRSRSSCDYAALRHTWEAPGARLVLDTAIMLAGGIVAILAGVRFSVEGRVLRPRSLGRLLRRRVGDAALRDRPGPRRARSRRASRAGRRSSARCSRAALIALAPFVRGTRRRAQRAARQLGRRAARARSPVSGWRSARSGARLPPLDVRPDAAGSARSCSRSSLSLQALLQPPRGDRLRAALPQPRRRPRPLARARRDAQALLGALPRVHAARSRARLSRRATSCACSRTACCSSASGARSASPSSDARSRRSARASRGRSTTGSRSTSSRSRRTRACSRAASRRRRRSRASRSSRWRRSRRRASPCSRSRPPAAARPSTRRSGATSSSSTADGALDVDVEIDPRDAARAGRADRGLPDRPGRARERPQARRRAASRGLGSASATAGGSSRSRDDGVGFEEQTGGAGQGLRNIRQRAASIAGAVSVRSRPGRGTTVEIALRA